MKTYKLVVMAAMLAFLSLSNLSAQVWNATADFSGTSNPNGAWCSGWTATLGSAFHLYPNVRSGDIILWYDPSIEVLGTPAFGKNMSSNTINGIAPGQIVLHGGCHAQEFSVLRWIAPVAGTYSIESQFFAGDIRDTTAYVLQNADAINPLFATASTNNSPSFTTTVSLEAGEFIDFVVGTGGDCFYDSTPLTAVIRLDCPSEDVTGDCCMDDADLAAVIFDFGGPESGSFGNTDLNDDGIVDDADLAEVIFNFGSGC